MRADARRIKSLDQSQHLLEIFLWNTRVQRHFLRRALEKSVIIDIANDELRSFAISGTEQALIQLPDQALVKRFLHRNGIERKLALILRFPRTARASRAVARRLRQGIAPCLI